MGWMRTTVTAMMERTSRLRGFMEGDVMVDDERVPHARSAAAEQSFRAAMDRMDRQDREYDESVAPVVAKLQAWGDEGVARAEQHRAEQDRIRAEGIAAFQAQLDEIDVELDRINRGEFTDER